MTLFGTNISNTTHNWSLAFLKNNQIFAIEIERLIRIKGYPNFNNVTLIQKILFVYNMKKFFNITDFSLLNNYGHHFLHAVSAYFSTKNNNATILCIDKDGFDKKYGHQFQTIWSANKLEIKNIYSTPIKSYFDRGIGYTYTLFSEYFGLSEGAFMGLAAYGDKNCIQNIDLFDYRDEGVYLNKEFFEGIPNYNIEPTDLSYPEYLDKNIKHIYKNIEKIFSIHYEGFFRDNTEVNNQIANISAFVQNEFEKAVLFLVQKAKKICKSDTICLTGGVFLNILVNKKIIDKQIFQHVYFSQFPEDNGLSLGELYYKYHILGKNNKRITNTQTGFGKQYSQKEILDTLKKYNNKISFTKYNNKKILLKTVAQNIYSGNIIGFFNGRSEFGPRALGNRSILAATHISGNKNKLIQIKNREPWRPFAISILEENVGKFLDIDTPSPYMSLCGKVLPKKKEILSQVIHIDDTVRYQTVNTHNNPNFRTLLEEYQKISGNGVLINTSMNVKKEPIVESPDHAIKLFLSTNLDILIIDDFLISKVQNFNQFAFDYNKVIVTNNLQIKKIKEQLG